MDTRIIQRTALSLFMVLVTVAFYFALSTPAEAQQVRNAYNTNASSTIGVKPKVNTTCMSAAIVTREDSLAGSWTTYQTNMTTSLATRKAALVDAWAKESRKERSASLKKIWKEWRTSIKAIHGKLRTEREAAWETFKTTAKNECKVTLPQEEKVDKETNDTMAL